MSRTREKLLNIVSSAGLLCTYYRQVTILVGVHFRKKVLFIMHKSEYNKFLNV